MVRILKFYTVILASTPCVLAISDCLPELDWDEFQKCFSKQYATLEHSQAHQKAYKQNLNLVQNCNKRYNAGQQSYSCSTNQYSDYPTSRLQELMLHPIQYSHDEHVERVEYIEDTPPSSINWIEKGAVTSVKNQGTCGSCWAFSSVGALESHYQIETGALRELSEQQLLDCSGYLGTMGCKGGNIEKAFEYIVENHGLDGLQDYPYSGVDGLPCDKNRTQRHIAVMFNFSTTLPNSEAQLEAAVGKYGPVAVAIQANQTSFLQYKQGIFDDESCGTSLDHGVLVVGYTKDYWIVKNSWGDTWGEKGYIRMKRGVGTKGICGIASFPSFPRVHKGKALPIPDPTPSPPPGLPCLCTTSCQRMCLQFGMHCCDGTGGNCNCQPPRETCCTKRFLPEPSLIAKSESAQPAQEG